MKRRAEVRRTRVSWVEELLQIEGRTLDKARAAGERIVEDETAPDRLMAHSHKDDALCAAVSVKAGVRYLDSRGLVKDDEGHLYSEAPALSVQP